jgi:hypothetical protein
MVERGEFELPVPIELAIMPAKGKVCKFEGLTPSLSPIR